MGISNLLIKLKVYNIVRLTTVFYWIFGLIARIYPYIFMADGILYFIHVKLIIFATTIIIINILILLIMIYIKVAELNKILKLLLINILTLVFGIFFVGFPIMMM